MFTKGSAPFYILNSNIWHLLLSIICIIAILLDVKCISLWYWVSLTYSDVECYVIWFTVICISSLAKCLFNCFAIFKLGRFVISLLTCKKFLCVWIQILYQINDVNVFFPQSVYCSFILLSVYFEVHKFLFW